MALMNAVPSAVFDDCFCSLIVIATNGVIYNLFQVNMFHHRGEDHFGPFKIMMSSTPRLFVRENVCPQTMSSPVQYAERGFVMTDL